MKIGRKIKNKKLVEFGKRSARIQKLGFESIIVIGMEKNDGSGKTFLSTKCGKDELGNVDCARFEKAVSHMLFILGSTPAEIINSVESLKAMSEAAQIHSIGALLQNLASDLEKMTDKKKPKKKRKSRSGWRSAFNDHVESTIDQITIEEIPTGRLSSYRYTKEAENEAENKLSVDDKKKLIAIRRRKNRLVKERNYEAAAKARDEERELLGMNG